MMTLRSLRGFAIRPRSILFAVVLVAGGATAPGMAASPQSGAATGDGGSLADRYCANIADKARDARFARHSRKLREMTDKLKEQIKLVEEKSEELKGWVERRDKFLSLGNDSLINIYSGMRPDAASQQLLNLPEAVAAAVIMKLEPRLSSAILNEMDPVRAGRLATLIAGIGQFTRPDGGT